MPWLKPLAGLALSLALVAPASAATLTGRWSLELDPDFSGNPATLLCDVTQDRQQLTLECGDAPVIAGTIDDRTVKFVIMTGRDNLLPAAFSGRLDANDTVIVGTWRLEDTTGNKIGRFRAEKR